MNIRFPAKSRLSYDVEIFKISTRGRSEIFSVVLVYRIVRRKSVAETLHKVMSKLCKKVHCKNKSGKRFMPERSVIGVRGFEPPTT